jgi:hypothetical protein
MKAREYPLESIRSPIHLLYSTLGQNPAATVPISYFLTAARSQDRFDISTEIVVSRPCWQGRTSSLTMMLQKCMTILFLLLWLKSRPQNLVSWHQNSFHKMASILHTNVYVGSLSATTCLYVDRSHLSSDLIVWLKSPSLDWTRYPL